MKLQKPSDKPLLVLMTKWPAVNRCKKRLSKGIGAVQAASIQQRLTFHTISVANKLQKKGFIEFKLAIAGIGPRLANRWGKEMGVRTISIQNPGSLGLRLKKEILSSQKRKQLLYRKGKKAAIIIGTDLPTLCELDLIQAIKKLKTTDLVIGPSDDGGYWLIGLSGKIINSCIPLPFDGIKWGTRSVLKETIFKTENAGIKYELLKYKNDLDHIEDLLPWQQPKHFPS